MKYLILDLPDDGPALRRAEAGIGAAGVWARFGRTLFVHGAAAAWPGVTRAVGKQARAAQGPAGEFRKGHLHLVVQKGRTFQLEEPDVPVLLDKGRFLVVDLPPARARSLAGRQEPCFHIEPLAENRVVFDQRPPGLRKARAAPEVADVVAAVSRPVFEAALTRLTSIRSRLSTGPGYAEAAEWMRGELVALGLAATLERIDVNGAASHNVVASRPGQGASRRHVLVTAHLDSVNHSDGPEAPAPGADDNASGSAGVLVLARALQGAALTHDMTFILFGGEEQGLFGSRQYVAALPAPERQRISAVLNMDMIGSVNSQPPGVMLEGAAMSQAMIDALAEAAASFTDLAVQTSLNPFASDHVPFIQAGIPAVLTIEGADSANEGIHSGNDTPDRIDAGFATEILRMNAGYLAVAAGVAAAPLVEPPAPSQPVPQPVPQPVACGCCGPAVSDGGGAALRQLSAHYHALFAQYARLQQQGAIGAADLANHRAAWLAHEALVSGQGRR